MPHTPSADRPHKHDRIRRILEARGAEAMLLTDPANLSWFFDGARPTVPTGGPAVFSALIRRHGTPQVTALENEIERLADEELSGAEFRTVPWFGALTEHDSDTLLDTDAAAELRTARAALLPVERARYTDLGAEVAAAMTAVLSAARPEHREHDLAAALTHAVASLGATASVVLVAGAERGGVQHPLPTHALLGDRAMGVVTAVRHGLHVSVTRWVRFRGVERPESARLREVEADAFSATVPGRTLAEVLADIGAAYTRHGFDAASRSAWRAHHQGGPTGYLGRDPKATPGSDVQVIAGGAFAWNPWVPHDKIEDTVIIDEQGVQVLSADPAWPTVDVQGLPRPIELQP